MSSFKNKITISAVTKENYKSFKSDLKQILDSIINLKNIEYENQYKDLLSLSDKKENELFTKFLFITYYSKLINLNSDYIFENELEINKLLNKFKIYNNNFFTKDIFELILYLNLFSLMQVEKNILFIIQNQDAAFIINKKLKQINECYYLLIQNLLLILKLYKENIYSLNQVLIFVDAIVVFINKNSINKDKYIYLKNLILFDLLFVIYLRNIANIILKEKQENMKDIDLFFNYLTKYLKREELKYYYNLSIVSHKKYALNLIAFLLNNFDYNKNIEIYNKYKNDMIKCLVNLYKNNTSSFNFFDTLINQNKQSFINLVNFESSKDLIIKDLYAQNFFIE